MLLAIVLAVILGLHAASIIPEHNWYNQFWWLDWILHFAGGAWVTCLLLALVPRVPVFINISFVFAVSFLWEVLEYIFDIPFFGAGEASFADSLWILDTLIDIVIAMVAAAIVGALANRYTKSNV